MSFDELLQEMVDQHQQDQLSKLLALAATNLVVSTFLCLALDWHPTIILLDVSGALKKSYLD